MTLKLIQVYVTDNKGNPVPDLEEDNFIIYDNEKKQKLTEFEKHLISFPGETKEQIEKTPVSFVRKLMPRKFFLFFDLAFNNAKGLEKSRQAALHFIDTQLQPIDEVGVLSYSAIKSLKLHEYLTTDHNRVRDIVKGFGIKEIAGRAEDFEAEYWSLLKEENPRDASSSGYVFDPKEQRKQELEFLRKKREESKLQTYNFVQKMTELAKSLRYVHGQKSIIFFSSGVPYSLVAGIPAPEIYPLRLKGDDPKPIDKLEEYSIRRRLDSYDEGFESSHLSFRYEDMLKELSAANCTIYALDTQEPSAALVGDLNVRGVFSLQKMTSETGGKYFGNINNYEQHIEKIHKITGSYYVLGYYVDDIWDGKYHQVKVEVDRPGLKVYAQKGYFNPKPFKEYSDLEKMLHLVDLALSENPLFQTPLRFPLKALPSSAQGKQNLALWARLEKEKIQEIAARKMEIVTILFDDKDNIVKMERKEADLSRLPEGPLYLSSFLPLTPGEYKCRLVLRNLESGRGAVASSSVSLPEPQAERLRLYPPLLLKEDKEGFYLQVSRTPVDFPFGRTKYAPLFEELERGKESLYAAVRCAHPGIQKPEIKLLGNLLKYQGDTTTAIPVSISILESKREADSEVFLLQIKTENLEAGEYLLYLFAQELNTGVISQVNTSFKVK
ncbi:MAG: VWA domain-containing protein [Clostridiales bacterium]|nr:VWA domain-containing protein [Clostridiales bacterium]